MKLYKIIYADPPWHFESKQLQKYNGERFASLASREYSTMTVHDICELPIIRIAHDDSALFLWVTDAHIPEALEVIKAWGFKYITVAFIWSKKTPNAVQSVRSLTPGLGLNFSTILLFPLSTFATSRIDKGVSPTRYAVKRAALIISSMAAVLIMCLL